MAANVAQLHCASKAATKLRQAVDYFLLNVIYYQLFFKTKKCLLYPDILNFIIFQSSISCACWLASNGVDWLAIYVNPLCITSGGDFSSNNVHLFIK